MIKKLASIAALVIATAPLASAQTSNMVFVDHGSLFDGHYFVGPYTALQDGNLITINCVDFFHEIDPPSLWTANVSQLTGDLSNTRAGGDVSGLAAYQQAAYLTTLYPGATDQETIDIQHAIWRLFAPDEAFILTGNDYLLDAGSDSYLALANSNYLTSGIDYSQFFVLTDVNAAPDSYVPDELTVQEFITSTPEPSSMALLGTGLVGLVPLVRRRKK